MGVCFSKNKQPSTEPNPKDEVVDEVKIKKNKNPNQIQNVAEKEDDAMKKEAKSPNQVVVVEKNKPSVFVITPKPSNPVVADDRKTKSMEKEKQVVVKACVEEPLPVAVRTSSCSKEEVDAILIQCGRLSRSSSAKGAGGSSDNNSIGLQRKYSGSKRSYDFDNERSMRDEEENQVVSRPSPRRRTSNRERSGSRERGGGGGGSRRVSRSPGRRSDGPAALSSVGERNLKQQQPAKMVSVPAREKGIATGGEKKKAAAASASTGNRRNASPRSRSPANNGRVVSENAGVHQPPPQPQSLSRSSSRKAEQSPFRRSPMTEIDENSLRGNNSTNKVQKSREETTQFQTQKTNEVTNNVMKKKNNSFVREQLKSCRPKEREPEIVEEAKEPKGEIFNNRTLTRTRSSRRSSHDFDHILGLNPDTNIPNATTYTSLLLEDIQNYQQQNAGFSLPACVSKACSILEAVADLNSSSSDQSNNDNGRFGRRGLNHQDPFVESEVVGKDDLMEPSLEKYISDMEPQESAGSNSFVGQPWHSSWEMNSVDSTDRYRTSQSNHGEEPEEELAVREFEPRGRSLRGGGSSSNTSLPNTMTSSSGNKKRDFDHRQLVRGGGNGKGGGGGGGRAFSNPVAASTS